MAIQDGSAFTVEIRDAEGPVVVILSGELDLATAPELRECLQSLGTDRPRDVLVDLASLTFIDSTGISVLVMACKRTRSQGGSFSMVSPHPDTYRALQVTGILDFLMAPLPDQD